MENDGIIINWPCFNQLYFLKAKRKRKWNFGINLYMVNNHTLHCQHHMSLYGPTMLEKYPAIRNICTNSKYVEQFNCLLSVKSEC